MASLTGQSIKDTYQSLLKTDDNGLITNAFKGVTDGSGSASGLYLRNNGVLLSGSITISGSLLYSGSTINATVTSASYALTASYAMNGGGGGSVDTGSFATTSSNVFVGNQTISGSINFGDGSIIQSTSASSGDGNGYTTLTLQPDTSLATDQYVVLDPTTPNHIHIRAGGIIDSSSAYLYLGGEKSNVVVRNLDNSFNEKHWVQINSQTGSTQHTWIFDDDGTLSVPGDITGASNLATTGSNQFNGNQGITGSLEQGSDTQAIGNSSHAEGQSTKTGTQNAYYAESVVSGVVTLSGSYGDISGQFGADNRLYLYDTPFDDNYGKEIFIVSQSYFDSNNTIVELYDTSVNTTTAYVGDLGQGVNNWTGDQTIPGDYSHAEGQSTQAIGNRSHAEGFGTLAIGNRSHAEGYNTQAIGQSSHAEGNITQAIGDYSHAEGNITQAIGEYSHAEGDNTRAIGEYSHAEGQEAISVGSYSHAEGYDTRATGNYSHAEGAGTKTGTQNAYYAESVVSGVITLSGSYGDITGEFAAENRLYLYDLDNNNNRRAHIISQSYFDSTNTIVELYDTGVNADAAYVGNLNWLSSNGSWNGDQTIPGLYSHAEGFSTSVLGFYSHAEGRYSIAAGDFAHAEGNRTQALNDYSHAEGRLTVASRWQSHAEGNRTHAGGISSHAEGDRTVALGEGSHAEGDQTIASGSYSHAEGYQTIASGSYSHAEGNITQAIGDYSHAEGDNTRAVGNYSHAEGQEAIASGSYSHAEGYDTRATGNYSHAEGYQTIASGSYSHTEGTTTQAIGEYSHAEGDSTQAIGNYSHAEGNYTIASGSYQHVSGQFNQHNNDTSYFVVGIGLTEETRKDGFTVDVDANGSGSVMIPNNLNTPSVAKTGSMYVDPANNKLWIYTGNGGVSGWVTSSLG
jgi:hypothetical protein